MEGLENYNIFFKEHYRELLRCNTNLVDVAQELGEPRVVENLRTYEESTTRDANYVSPGTTLEAWRDLNHPHPFAQHIALICASLNLDTILDAGCGVGTITKFIRTVVNPEVRIHCIEGNTNTYKYLQENFFDNYSILPPYIMPQNTTTHCGSLHDLSRFKDGEFDLVFTCTVAMHLPFIPGVAILSELARVTSRYILHVENVRPCTAIGEMKYKRENTLGVDYEKLYEKLGFRCLINFVNDYPYEAGHKYRVYLGEKNP